VAGVLAGLMGIGGGLVIVPALIWVFGSLGFEGSVLVHLAVGTSLATIVVTGLSSVLAHHKRGAVRWDLVWRLTPGILLGAFLGAWIADYLTEIWLRRFFASFLLLVALRMLRASTVHARYDLPGPWGTGVVGTGIGAISAIVGIGGGTMTVPFLSACRVSMRQAVATSSACGVPIAVAGGLGFLWTGWAEPDLPLGSTGYIYWPAFVGIVLASTPSAPLGARLAHSLPVETLKRAFAILLLIVAIRLLAT